MSIADLPDELLFEMCESWDTTTLLNMSQAYSRVYQVCSDVVDSRRNEFLRQKKISEIIKKNQGRYDVYYKLINDYENPKGSSHKGSRLTIGSASRFWGRYPGFIYLARHKIVGEKDDMLKELTNYGYTSDEAIDIIHTEGITKNNYQTTMKDIYLKELRKIREKPMI